MIECVDWYRTRDLIEAQMLLDLLAAEEVDARLFNQELLGAIGELPTTVCPEIWLQNEAQRPRALEVLGAYERRQLTPSEGSRACANCGESNPEHFELCWSCRSDVY